jgi:hypothetical protein
MLSLQAAVGAIIVLAAVGKLSNPGQLAETVVAFGVPRRHAGHAGTAVAVTELAVGIALLLPDAQRLQVGAVVMCAVYVVVQVTIRRRGFPSCRCLGLFEGPPGSAFGLLRATALLAVAAASLFVDKPSNYIDGHAAGALAGLAGLAAITLIAHTQFLMIASLKTRRRVTIRTDS